MKDYWKLYEQVAGWVKFADAKISGVIAGNALLFTLLSKYIEKLILPENASVTINYVWMLKLALLLIIVSVILSFFALKPKLFFKELNTPSLIYFEQISCKCQKQYIEGLEIIDEIAFKKELMEQIWQLSVVASRKTFRVALSMYFLFGAIFCLFIWYMLLLYTM
ncbi:MAG: hypothetical protein GY853_10405 [PVC group bacterium]|nr:hypothetical protein [PVC group bacterium]